MINDIDYKDRIEVYSTGQPIRNEIHEKIVHSVNFSFLAFVSNQPIVLENENR